MTKSMIQDHNSATGEIIEREMTAEEVAIHERDIIEKKAQDAEKAAKDAARAELLTRLGITAEEAALLLA
jgi:hypothetical protein